MEEKENELLRKKMVKKFGNLPLEFDFALPLEDLDLVITDTVLEWVLKSLISNIAAYCSRYLDCKAKLEKTIDYESTRTTIEEYKKSLSFTIKTEYQIYSVFEKLSLKRKNNLELINNFENNIKVILQENNLLPQEKFSIGEKEGGGIKFSKEMVKK